jgi:agmatinase
MDTFFDRPYRSGISSVPLGMPLNVSKASVTTKEMNAKGAKINAQLKSVASPLVEKNKIVGVIGGEHSAPLGLMQALAEKESYGILHIDAHHDLREAYEGYQFSHASIMYNALQSAKNITRLVSVGIRDFSEDEAQTAKDRRISTYYWGAVNRQLLSGRSWHDVVKDILQDLPDRVYVSFDIDGLSPEFCPSTGTPVPGGLSFDQASYLLEELGRSQKKIVGFDLCEVAPQAQTDDEWDANVGARILYKLCGAALASQGQCAILGE